uniref:Uncharacterized protein n=1 Tax=viral metagenome TaxID=1070528 RepID=A0A6M3LBQ1_9ZZZZ
MKVKIKGYVNAEKAIGLETKHGVLWIANNKQGAAQLLRAFPHKKKLILDKGAVDVNEFIGCYARIRVLKYAPHEGPHKNTITYRLMAGDCPS